MIASWYLIQTNITFSLTTSLEDSTAAVKSNNYIYNEKQFKIASVCEICYKLGVFDEAVASVTLMAFYHQASLSTLYEVPQRCSETAAAVVVLAAAVKLPAG